MKVPSQCDERFSATYFGASAFLCRWNGFLSLRRPLVTCSLQILNSRKCCMTPTTHGCGVCKEKFVFAVRLMTLLIACTSVFKMTIT
jgi:hypothetical protein